MARALPVQPAGMALIPDFITPETEAKLLQAINEQPWSQELSRQVQHYGFRYHYKTRQITAAALPLPEWLPEISAITEPATAFNQVIINEYRSGQGIAKHSDDPKFGPVICSLTLGTAAEMILRGPAGDVHPIMLEPRSLLVLTGAARYQYTHEIPKKKRPGVRVSITWRTYAPK